MSAARNAAGELIIMGEAGSEQLPVVIKLTGPGGRPTAAGEAILELVKLAASPAPRPDPRRDEPPAEVLLAGIAEPIMVQEW